MSDSKLDDEALESAYKQRYECALLRLEQSLCEHP